MRRPHCYEMKISEMSESRLFYFKLWIWIVFGAGFCFVLVGYA